MLLSSAKNPKKELIKRNNDYRDLRMKSDYDIFLFKIKNYLIFN